MTAKDEHGELKELYARTLLHAHTYAHTYAHTHMHMQYIHIHEHEIHTIYTHNIRTYMHLYMRII